MDIETTRPFYVVFSSRSMENISTLISDYELEVKESFGPDLELYKFSLLVPDKFHKQQTMRTFVVVDPNVFDSLKSDEKNIPNFRIEKLQMKKHFYPNKDYSELPNLYISLPSFLSLTQCQTHLIERMASLMKLGMWDKSDYTINFPRIDRIGDSHKNVAFILFKDPQRLDDIMLTKLFINNTKWPDTNHEVHCFWSKTKEGREAEAKRRQEYQTKEKESNKGKPESKSDGKSDDKQEGSTKNVWVEKKGKHI